MLPALLLLSSLTVSPESDFPWMVRQGDTLFAQRRYEEAAVSYDSAAALDPSRAEPLWKLARVYIAESETVTTDTRRELSSGITVEVEPEVVEAEVVTAEIVE